MQRRVRGLQSSFRHLLGLFCPFVHRADLYIRYVIIMLATEQFLFMHVYVTYLCVCASITIPIEQPIAVFVHRKNDFAKIFKNLTRYRSKNNFVGPSKESCRTLKHNEQCLQKVLTFYYQLI